MILAELRTKIKQVRESQSLTQEQAAVAFNAKHKTGYNKSFPCGLEGETARTSMEQVLKMLEALGCEYNLIIKEPITKQWEVFTSKLSEQDNAQIIKDAKSAHAITRSSDLGEQLHFTNYFNRYIRFVPQRGNKGVVVMNKENNSKEVYLFVK